MEHVAVVVAALVALVATWALGFVLIPLLRRLKFGQTINEIGPKWHKAEKQGIPTMGGFLFIGGSTLGLLVAYPLLGFATSTAIGGDLGVLILGVFTTAMFSAIGFLDDYLKVVRKQNLGLRALQKTILQVIVGIGFLTTLHMMGRLSTILMLPIFGAVDFGFFFYPLALLLIVFMVNAVNLTDGLDGLASTVTFWVMCGYFILLTMLAKTEMLVWTAALAGGCVGFLFWNFHPAKIFMGDTGSMFLGGAVTVIGFCVGCPEVILILGLVYAVEALSVVIQVTYFKITHGKRLFKMTPIHHHFELIGWSEMKIVLLFGFAAMVCAALGCLYGYLVL